MQHLVAANLIAGGDDVVDGGDPGAGQPQQRRFQRVDVLLEAVVGDQVLDDGLLRGLKQRAGGLAGFLVALDLACLRVLCVAVDAASLKGQGRPAPLGQAGVLPHRADADHELTRLTDGRDLGHPLQHHRDAGDCRVAGVAQLDALLVQGVAGHVGVHVGQPGDHAPAVQIDDCGTGLDRRGDRGLSADGDDRRAADGHRRRDVVTGELRPDAAVAVNGGHLLPPARDVPRNRDHLEHADHAVEREAEHGDDDDSGEHQRDVQVGLELHDEHAQPLSAAAEL